jgi:hypothetical protein
LSGQTLPGGQLFQSKRSARSFQQKHGRHKATERTLKPKAVACSLSLRLKAYGNVSHRLFFRLGLELPQGTGKVRRTLDHLRRK